MLLRRTLVVACVALLAPRGVRAVQYEVFVDIETEEDLYDLLATGQISEPSFNALLLLHQTRVELNRADRERLYLLPNLDYAHVDRILAYRNEVGVIRALGDLVAADVVESELAESLRAFVTIRPFDVPKGRADGFLRTQARWSGRYDRLPPAAAIQARVRAVRHLDSGVVGTLTRNRVRRVQWDPARRGLSVEPESVRFEVPKAYVEWEDDAWEVVGGTYRIGFGQRLTFDVTDQVTPNGSFGDYELRRENELGLRCRRAAGELSVSPCPVDRVARVTPDFSWTNRLTGVAAGAKRLPLGTGWLQAYAWGSYQIHRAQQIEIVHAGSCDDPRRNEDPGCRAPAVYVRDGNPGAPSSVTSFASLPAVLAEGLGGANASYFWRDRAHLGITGYGAVPRWLVEGVDLDFQEFARKPFGGPFGAVGVNAAYGFARQDFFVEATRSFDRQTGGGGGWGTIVRSVTTLDAGELDVSARYYGSRYANPYARPISAPDELDGLRARDEFGLRVRTAMTVNARLSVRVLADGWSRLSSAGLNGLLMGRTDVQIASAWAWALWAEHQTTGQRTLLATKVAYEPTPRLTLSLQVQHRRLRALTTSLHRQSDLAAIFTLLGRPTDSFRIRARIRYDLEDVSDNHRLPHVVWTQLEADLNVRQHDILRARYDARVFLDERESTLRRVPNPEHWLWVEYVFRF